MDGDTHDQYVTIRDILGHFIGRTLVDITQHDKDEYAKNGRAYVSLLFDNGDHLTFPIGDDGFDYSGGDAEAEAGDGDESQCADG